jgi:hypothetical protein
MTGALAAWTAARLRQRFERLGLDIARLPIAGDIEDVEWLARVPGDLSAPDGPIATDKDRAINAFLKTFRLEKVAWALERCEGMSGFDGALERLQHLSVDPGDLAGHLRHPEAVEQAWDRLFEIEFAAMVKVAPFEPSFAEPDVVLAVPGVGRFGVACKRPRTFRSLARNVVRGCAQLGGEHINGLVAVNADFLIPQVDPRGLFVVTKSQAAVGPACERRLGKVLARCPNLVAEGLDRAGRPLGRRAAVAGVLVYANFVILAPVETQQGSYIKAAVWARIIPDIQTPGASEFLDLVRRAVVVGQDDFNKRVRPN